MVSNFRPNNSKIIGNQDLTIQGSGTTEPYVHDLLLSSENITFTSNNWDVIEECDLIFTFVATPSLAGVHPTKPVKNHPTVRLLETKRSNLLVKKLVGNMGHLLFPTNIILLGMQNLRVKN